MKPQRKFRVFYTVMQDGAPDKFLTFDMFGANPDEVRKRCVVAGKLEHPGAGIVVRKIKVLAKDG